MRDADAALLVTDLWKYYGDRPALRGVYLGVKPGEIAALVGPNGAGKTTLLRCIMSLVSCEGEIRILGVDPRLDRSVYRRVGFVPDAPGLYAELTVYEHLALAASLRGITDTELDASARRVAAEMGLEELLDKKVDELSRGQAQRLAIAMALVGNPHLILLDEPYNSLDVEHQWRLKKLLRRLASRGAAILFTSHVMQWVEDIADRVIVLHEGRVVTEGSAEEVAEKLGGGSLEEAIARLASYTRGLHSSEGQA